MFQEDFIPKNQLFPSNKGEKSVPRGSKDEINFAAIVGLTVTQLQRIEDITILSKPQMGDFYCHFDCGYCGRYLKDNDSVWIGFDFRFHRDFQFQVSFRLPDNKNIENKLKKTKNELLHSILRW